MVDPHTGQARRGGQVRDATQAEAKTLGNVDVQFEDAQGDVGRQLSQAQNFIA